MCHQQCPKFLNHLPFLNSDLALNEIYENNKITFSLNEIHIFVNLKRFFLVSVVLFATDFHVQIHWLTSCELWSNLDLDLCSFFSLYALPMCTIEWRALWWRPILCRRIPLASSHLWPGTNTNIKIWYLVGLMGSPNKTTTWHDDLTRTQTSKSDTL